MSTISKSMERKQMQMQVLQGVANQIYDTISSGVSATVPISTKTTIVSSNHTAKAKNDNDNDCGIGNAHKVIQRLQRRRKVLQVEPTKEEEEQEIPLSASASVHWYSQSNGTPLTRRNNRDRDNDEGGRGDYRETQVPKRYLEALASTGVSRCICNIQHTAMGMLRVSMHKPQLFQTLCSSLTLSFALALLIILLSPLSNLLFPCSCPCPAGASNHMSGTSPYPVLFHGHILDCLCHPWS